MSAAQIHISNMIFVARFKLDILCARIGWHMATYLSTVKAVMVNMEAEDVISVRNTLRRQYASPNLHGYASQTAISSGGNPEKYGQLLMVGFQQTSIYKLFKMNILPKIMAVHLRMIFSISIH